MAPKFHVPQPGAKSQFFKAKFSNARKSETGISASGGHHLIMCKCKKYLRTAKRFCEDNREILFPVEYVKRRYQIKRSLKKLSISKGDIF
uniref:Uncharacterized protein n=1 Tax=Romanomermis culicivorax TaxID=13658 RepID=A0A915KKU3_ROMCU